MKYGGPPKDLGRWDGQCEEMLFYQYFPVKLSGTETMDYSCLERRLLWTADFIGMCACDFVSFRGLNEFVQSNIYLTAKHLWVSTGENMNRPGWHSDGFGTPDVNYVWSNCVPTIFNDGPFDLPEDDVESIVEMGRQVQLSENYTFPDCHVLRMDEKVIHQTGSPTENQLRTFLKLSFSRDRYDLLGNAVNPVLDYDWEMRPRSKHRNTPQELTGVT